MNQTKYSGDLPLDKCACCRTKKAELVRTNELGFQRPTTIEVCPNPNCMIGCDLKKIRNWKKLMK